MIFIYVIFVYVMRRMSHDWETVRMLSHETVHRNQIKLAAMEKALNSQKYLITLYIQVYLIIKLSLGSIETDRIISETV